MSTTPGSRVAALRAAMARRGLQAYVVTSQDAHLSEYTAPFSKRREWLSGFSGSAGTAVVTQGRALLWTDGRYYQQALKELAAPWELVRAADPGAKTVPQFLASELPTGARVGIDGMALSAAAALQWDKTLRGREGESRSRAAKDALKATCQCRPLLERDGASANCGACRLLVPLSHDLVDELWGAERPARPRLALRVHPEAAAGESARDKLAAARALLAQEGADCLVLGALDEIAWLLNLRGSDIPHTPVFFAFLVLGTERCVLLVDREAAAHVAAHLASSAVDVVDYDHHLEVLGDLAATLKPTQRCGSPSAATAAPSPASSPLSPSSSAGGKRQRVEMEPAASASAPVVAAKAPLKVWLDTDASALGLHLACSAGGNVILAKPSPIKRAKAQKNAAELAGMREAHVLEGVSLTRFLAWLERRVASEPAIDEAEAADEVERFRSMHATYLGPSFETISAYGSNGAVVHYKPQHGKALRILGDSLFLLDTGGQYANGTTDMTRTMCFGAPTEEQREAFSLVLEGHIQLALAVVPRGVEPAKLDVIARAPLWRRGLDYRHGTSHGVGAALGVHEYPPLLHANLPSARTFTGKYSPTSMAPGMCLSNEPGFYLAGAFGIRIENVMVASAHAKPPSELSGKFDSALEWLSFETITVVPLQRKMIRKDLLSPEAVRWVNEYQDRCRRVLEPLLDRHDDEPAREWLRRETQHV
jgi:Xaa-Pro aminopeptidase